MYLSITIQFNKSNSWARGCKILNKEEQSKIDDNKCIKYVQGYTEYQSFTNFVKINVLTKTRN